MGKEDDKKSEWELFMDDDSVPCDPKARLNATQRLRFGLINKHIHETSDPKMLARVESIANGIDKQELTIMRMDQDKEEGQANREIADELFKKFLLNDTKPTGDSDGTIESIDTSEYEVLEDELIQGDDTINSVI